MNLHNAYDAYDLAAALMSKNGLGHWRLEFKDWVWSAGVCYRPARVITLSRLYVELPEWTAAHTREIALHEIAHALTSCGHDEAWRVVALRIGGSGEEKPRLPWPRGRGEVDGGRVRWWARLPCESGDYDYHPVWVEAVREDDDDGGWMRLESVRLEPTYRDGGGTKVRWRGREVLSRLSVSQLMDLSIEAQEEWSRAMDANRVAER